MFGYLISLYQPLLHDIFRTVMTTDRETSGLGLMMVLGAGVFGAMMFEMWRSKDLQPRPAAWVFVLGAVVCAVGCARQLFVLGFEGRHLINAMILLWLAPGVVVILASEVVRMVGRVATRRLVTAT